MEQEDIGEQRGSGKGAFVNHAHSYAVYGDECRVFIGSS